ncbi:uncharacterized protein LOC122385587 [Amphibalanus amphitrite]|uniref:uncharacterized protein LOC122385587 n=1 Tax=Amphibalanus amphitrite TaxID=1232801 RepID=UPI001C906277|nr:uncharacterized protein LOC122385587 [Amphibalanus amphitrite]
MNKSALPGFGVEIKEVQYESFLDWLVAFRSIDEAWAAQPTFLLSEYAYYVIAVLTLCHAFYLGGRWPYMWLGSLIHGLVIENISMNIPDIENYWQSQTTIVFLGRKMPLHIMLIYPVMEYPAHYCVAHLRLPRYAQALMAGLLEVLIDLPYDIMCVRFLHWTWHDTDPNIFDRHYWVPWNSYYFHLSFGVSFYFFLQLWRRVLTGDDSHGHHGGVGRELLCALLAGICGMPGGVLQFLPLYHPLHDIFGVHSENTLLMIAALYTLLVWSADRRAEDGSRPRLGQRNRPYLVMFCLLLHYAVYWSMAVFFNPEDEISIGLHEKVGPCDVYQDVHTAFGMTLKKRKYLCATDYDEGYFDFRCLPGGRVPAHGARWYTICGVPFANRAEYVSMITAITVFALGVFYQCLFRSGPQVQPARQQKMKRF